MLPDPLPQPQRALAAALPVKHVFACCHDDHVVGGKRLGTECALALIGHKSSCTGARHGESLLRVARKVTMLRDDPSTWPHNLVVHYPPLPHHTARTVDQGDRSTRT